MKPEKKPFLPARSYIDGIQRSNQYLETRRNNPEYTHEHAVGALAREAFERAEQPDKHMFALAIIGRAPDLVPSQRTLDDIRERRRNNEHISRPEKQAAREAKDKVIQYNHALRQLIDHYPDTTQQEILTIVNGAVIELGSRELLAATQANTRDILMGMWHEIAAEDAFWSVGEVDSVEQATIAQEKKGIDLVVGMQDGRTFELDIKASERGEREYQGSGTPFWTGINLDGVAQGWRPTPEQKETIVDRFQDKVLANRTVLHQVV